MVDQHEDSALAPLSGRRLRVHAAHDLGLDGRPHRGAVVVSSSRLLRGALVALVADLGGAVRAFGCVYDAVRHCDEHTCAAVVLDLAAHHAPQALNYFLGHRSEAPVLALAATPCETEFLESLNLQRLVPVVRHAPVAVLRHKFARMVDTGSPCTTRVRNSRHDACVPPVETLTRREADIAAHLMQSNKAIARAMHISEKTVKNHVSAILRKTGCTNRREAFVLLREVHGACH